MNDDSTNDGLAVDARLRRERARLYAVGLTLLAGTAVAVCSTLPVSGIVSSIPLPGLPHDLRSSARWLKVAVLVAVAALVVIGKLEHGRRGDRPAGGEELE